MLIPRLLASEKDRPRVVIAFGLVWMAFVWHILYVFLLKYGAQASAHSWPGDTAFVTTATTGARWAVLIIAGAVEVALAVAALRSRRPAFWIVISAASVQVALVLFMGAQVLTTMGAAVKVFRALQTGTPKH
jgi:uncharacterized membrane protein YhaH (DUF805 family)